MAGLYSRFSDAGYTKPKYLLTNKKGEAILSVVVSNILDSYSFDNILLVANKRDIKYRKHIDDCIKSYKNATVVFVDDTKGQAHTTELGIEHLKGCCVSVDKKLVIHNIDTIIVNRDFCKIARLLDKYDGLIDVIESSNPGYSYVLSDENRVISKIVEKEVISDFATTGLYCFSDYDEYSYFFNSATFLKDELYVSDVYIRYIENGCKIFSYKAEFGHTYESGTPEQYESLKDDENFNSL